MIEVTFTGMRERLQNLNRIEREQLPYAAALALTLTVQDIKAAMPDEMKERFDRPTRYTLNSLFVEPATKSKMKARVWVKDRVQDGGGKPAAEWLAPQVYGGDRDKKGSEKRLEGKGILAPGQYVVPGKGMKLDKHGNISRGTVNKILSGLGAQSDSKANSTTSRRSKGNRNRYFVLKKDGRSLGIAERTGKGRSGMRMVLAFVRRPTYDDRFDFHAIAKRDAEDRLPINFEIAMARAIGTRRV